MKNKKFFIFGIFALILLIILVTATTFVDNSEGYFNNGTYYQTEWNSSGNFVWLAPSNNSGNYTSQIFNATRSSTWNNISWISSAILELPDNQIIETGFGSGNINMTGNEFLAHLNNDSVYGENDTSVYDFSGLGNNGTVTGAVPTTSGKFNGGFEFDGVDDTINISTISALSGVNVTISAWIYYKGSSGAYDPIVTQSDATWAGYYFYIDTSDSDKVGFWLDNAQAKSTQAVPANEWHHVVGTHNDTHLMVYMDGVLLDTYKKTGSGNAKDAFIGCDNPATDFFNGTIDEVAIWNRTLSLTEIKNLYKRGATELNLTVRSCDEENCVGESFIDISDSSPQDLSVSNNQYFQYKFDFTTENFTYSPELYNVTIDYTLSDITPPQGGGRSGPTTIIMIPNEEIEEVPFEKKALFDLIVSTLPGNEEIFSDTKEISFQVDLIKFNLPEELTKVKINYKLNKESKIIYEENEDLEVQKAISFIKTISLPELSLGTYQINIKIKYGDETREGKTSFIVREKRLSDFLKTIKGKIYLFAGILFLVLIIGIILFLKFRKRKCLKSKNLFKLRKNRR